MSFGTVLLPIAWSREREKTRERFDKFKAGLRTHKEAASLAKRKEDNGRARRYWRKDAARGGNSQK